MSGYPNHFQSQLPNASSWFWSSSVKPNFQGDAFVFYGDYGHVTWYDQGDTVSVRCACRVAEGV